jgi:hypothetical protein
MGLFDFFKKKDDHSSSLFIRYQYVWRKEIPENERDFKLQSCYKDSSCVFCKKLVDLNRYYTKEEIQKISDYVEYDVFNECGAVYDENEKLICACYWEKVVLFKKEKGA